MDRKNISSFLLKSSGVLLIFSILLIPILGIFFGWGEFGIVGFFFITPLLFAVMCLFFIGTLMHPLNIRNEQNTEGAREIKEIDNIHHKRKFIDIIITIFIAGVFIAIGFFIVVAMINSAI